jgi:sugar lactone lactonase YvrE
MVVSVFANVKIFSLINIYCRFICKFGFNNQKYSMKKQIYFLNCLHLSIALMLSTGAYAQIINTIAGLPSPGYFGNGGQATAAELNSPCQIAVDGSGNVYIADYGNNVIRMVTASTGIITTFAGNGFGAGTGTGGYTGDGGQVTAAELFYPTSIAMDASGNIYIADYDNNVIRKVTVSSGIITTVAGNGWGNGLGSGGYTGDGGQATAAELFEPAGIALDKSGNIYIADAANNVIRKITTSSGIINTIAGNTSTGSSGDGGQATSAELAFPFALALDDTGNVFIADWGNSRIRKVANKTGIITTIAGNGSQGSMGDGGQATAAELWLPMAVSIDASGNILIADSKNNLIRKVTASTGIISAIAGNGAAGYSGNGALALMSELDYPDGVATDTAGNIYYADGNNDVIREITGTDGINEFKVESEKLKVYPNPSNGKFTFQIVNCKLFMVNEIPQIEIYNVLGENLFLPFTIHNSQFTIDLSNQPEGIYFLKAVTEDGNTLVQKVSVIK